MESAKQMHWEDIMGSLEKGKLANLIVLDRNIFEVPLDKLKDVNVETVIFDGQVIKGTL